LSAISGTPEPTPAPTPARKQAPSTPTAKPEPPSPGNFQADLASMLGKGKTILKKTAPKAADTKPVEKFPVSFSPLKKSNVAKPEPPSKAEETQNEFTQKLAKREKMANQTGPSEIDAKLNKDNKPAEPAPSASKSDGQLGVSVKKPASKPVAKGDKPVAVGMEDAAKAKGKPPGIEDPLSKQKSVAKVAAIPNKPEPKPQAPSRPKSNAVKTPEETPAITLTPEYAALKEEILNALRLELLKAREEILAAVRG